jgi:hypothetical protein
VALTPEELPGYLLKIAQRAHDSGHEAANGMAHKFDRGIKTDELVRSSGAPSAPGSPPALESGRLRDSFRIVPAEDIGGDRWRSKDGPHTVYAHIQEYGGDIYPRVKLWLHWVSGDGTDHFAKHVRLPARPYMRPAARRMVADGSLAHGAIEGFEVQMWG